MSAITNFSPIQSINSLLKPLGLAISNKQQIINKTALAALAILVVTCGLATVEGNVWDVNQSRTFSECQRICARIQIPSEGETCNRRCRNALVLLSTRCYNACERRFSNYLD